MADSRKDYNKTDIVDSVFWQFFSFIVYTLNWLKSNCVTCANERRIFRTIYWPFYSLIFRHFSVTFKILIFLRRKTVLRTIWYSHQQRNLANQFWHWRSLRAFSLYELDNSSWACTAFLCFLVVHQNMTKMSRNFEKKRNKYTIDFQLRKKLIYNFICRKKFNIVNFQMNFENSVTSSLF